MSDAEKIIKTLQAALRQTRLERDYYRDRCLDEWTEGQP